MKNVFDKRYVFFISFLVFFVIIFVIIIIFILNIFKIVEENVIIENENVEGKIEIRFLS